MNKEQESAFPNCPFCMSCLGLKQDLLFCSSCDLFVGHPLTFKKNLEPRLAGSASRFSANLAQDYVQKRTSWVMWFWILVIATLLSALIFVF